MYADADFRIVPLDADYAARIRATRRDAFGQPVEERQDASPHQCRVCLTLTRPHEPYLLLSHRPHPAGALYAETGPVFIHDRDCAPYAAGDRYPPEFPQHEVVLKAFSAKHTIVDSQHALGRAPQAVIEALFADPDVAYIHARNLTYGCYMFRVERA
jgi:hypothetical protein